MYLRDDAIRMAYDLTHGILTPMRKTTIYLDEADDALLTQEATRRGASRTELIRVAIRRMLDSEAAQPPRPRPLGRSGHSDTSARVDEILSESFGD